MLKSGTQQINVNVSCCQAGAAEQGCGGACGLTGDHTADGRPGAAGGFPGAGDLSAGHQQIIKSLWHQTAVGNPEPSTLGRSNVPALAGDGIDVHRVAGKADSVVEFLVGQNVPDGQQVLTHNVPGFPDACLGNIQNVGVLKAGVLLPDIPELLRSHAEHLIFRKSPLLGVEAVGVLRADIDATDHDTVSGVVVDLETAFSPEGAEDLDGFALFVGLQEFGKAHFAKHMGLEFIGIVFQIGNQLVKIHAADPIHGTGDVQNALTGQTVTDDGVMLTGANTVLSAGKSRHIAVAGAVDEVVRLRKEDTLFVEEHHTFDLVAGFDGLKHLAVQQDLDTGLLQRIK